MNIRLIPVIVGATIGALTTYFYKDKKSRDALKKGIDATGETISDGVDSIKSTLTKKKKAEPLEIEETEDQADDEAVAEKPKTTRKRKTTTRKKPTAESKKAEAEK